MPSEAAENGGSDLAPVMVIMEFSASDVDGLTAILSKYVVLARSHPGARNIDFVVSATTPGRMVLVQKWDSIEAQQDHFDSAEMVKMAHACDGLLSAPPKIDLFEGASMHDLA